MKQNTKAASSAVQNDAPRCAHDALPAPTVPLSRAPLRRPVRLAALTLPEGAEAVAGRLSDLGFLPGVLLVPLGWVGKAQRNGDGLPCRAPVILRLRGYTAVVSPALAERMLVRLP